MSLAPAGPHPNPLPKGEGDLYSFGVVGHFAGRAGMTTPPGASICSNLFQFRCISGRFQGPHCLICLIDLVDTLNYSDQTRATTRVAPTTALSPWDRLRVRTVHTIVILTLTGRISWSRCRDESPLQEILAGVAEVGHPCSESGTCFRTDRSCAGRGRHTKV